MHDRDERHQGPAEEPLRRQHLQRPPVRDDLRRSSWPSSFFQFLTDGLTLDSDNLIALVSQYSYILILAIGMVMVIVAGHIDLSVGSVAAFVGIIVAKAMHDWNLPVARRHRVRPRRRRG